MAEWVKEYHPEKKLVATKQMGQSWTELCVALWSSWHSYRRLCLAQFLHETKVHWAPTSQNIHVSVD